MGLVYDRTGAGPPLLLLHGLGMSRRVWRPVVPMLAREREVIALDLPGFGCSPPGPRTIAGLADAVICLVAELGLERPHVAGNSLGGGLALTLGASGRVASVCALSPIGFAAGREADYERALLAATRAASRALAPCIGTLARGRIVRTVLSAHVAARPWRVPAADLDQWTHAYANAPGFWNLLDETVAWRAVTPVCPTTVAWGNHDRVLLFSRQAPRARRVLPHAAHVVLHGCGHVPTWDDPGQVAHAILTASG